MFRFEHPLFLNALWLIPILGGLAAWAFFQRTKTMTRLGQPAAVEKLLPGFSARRFWWKTGLFCLGLAFLAVGLANPQFGSKREKARQKSLDLLLALDISTSMMATDIRPNRLTRATSFCEKLLARRRSDRIGLIVFAGHAWLQMPLTNDFAAALLFLRTASPDMAPTQGTAIAEAIELAEKSLDRTAENSSGGNALIILTDGENHDDEAIDRAEQAAENGLALFPIAVGTPEGGQIPVDNGGGLPDWKRDENGEIVVSKLNEKLIADLAKAGNGRALSLSDGDAALNELENQLDRLEKRERETRSFSEFESWFQWAVALALLLFCLDFWLGWKRGAAF